MKDAEMLSEIADEFKKVKEDTKFDQNVKNIRYGQLMTLLEQNFNIPLLMESLTQFSNQTEEKAFALYSHIADERNFEACEEDDY